jgi:hypothetical protein
LSQVENNFKKISIETGKVRTGIGGRAKIMTPKIQLLIFLLYMRQYISIRFLSWITGYSISTLYKYNHCTMNGLFMYFEPKIQLDNYVERKKHCRLLSGAIITIVLDGTEQGVYKPKSKLTERSLYSGEKVKHTFTKLIVCSPMRIIYYLSPSYNGSMNDKNMIDLEENKFYRDLH